MVQECLAVQTCPEDDPYGILSSDIGDLFGRMVAQCRWDAVASLLQVHASRQNWCRGENCGDCPFAEGHCSHDDRARLAEDFARKYYASLVPGPISGE